MATRTPAFRTPRAATPNYLTGLSYSPANAALSVASGFVRGIQDRQNRKLAIAQYLQQQRSQQIRDQYTQALIGQLNKKEEEPYTATELAPPPPGTQGPAAPVSIPMTGAAYAAWLSGNRKQTDLEGYRNATEALRAQMLDLQNQNLQLRKDMLDFQKQKSGLGVPGSGGAASDQTATLKMQNLIGTTADGQWKWADVEQMDKDYPKPIAQQLKQWASDNGYHWLSKAQKQYVDLADNAMSNLADTQTQYSQIAPKDAGQGGKAFMNLLQGATKIGDPNITSYEGRRQSAIELVKAVAGGTAALRINLPEIGIVQNTGIPESREVLANGLARLGVTSRLVKNARDQIFGAPRQVPPGFFSVAGAPAPMTVPGSLHPVTDATPPPPAPPPPTSAAPVGTGGLEQWRPGTTGYARVR